MIYRVEAMVLALVSFIALPVMASPPVPPPAATSPFSSQTDIQCIGTVLESESYTRRWIGATDGIDGAQVVGQTLVDPFEQADGFDGFETRDDAGLYDPRPELIDLEAPASDVGGPGRAPVLGAGDTAGELRYEEEFNAIGGQVTYNKLFDTDTGGTPEDLDVDKTFTFVAAEPNGNLSFNERVGMTIVSNGFDVADAAPPVTDVIGGLCPWVQDPGGRFDEIPATNESVAMGSEILSASAVQANTATNVGLSVQAPNASYAIAGQGEGFIEASMAVQVQEGFGKVGWSPIGDAIFTGAGQLVGLQPAVYAEDGTTILRENDQAEIDAVYNDPANYKKAATVNAPNLALFEQYEETSSANGQWTFSKSMAYESQIPILQIPTPF